METSLKAGFAQIFSCCPKILSCPKFGGAAAPLAPAARTPMGGRGRELSLSLALARKTFHVAIVVKKCTKKRDARANLLFQPIAVLTSV